MLCCIVHLVQDECLDEKPTKPTSPAQLVLLIDQTQNHQPVPFAMSDSDDDKPIIALIEKRKLQQKERQRDDEGRPSKKAKESNGSAAAAPAAKVKVEVKAEKGKADKPTRSKGSSSSGQGLAKRVIAFYEETQKGLLVQRLLVRWWYAIEWPKADEIGQPPDGYESLDGFVGVYISTKSDSLGTIVDLRNKDNCPSLANLCAWPSARLKETLELAYAKQMEVLAEHEGEDCKLYRSLKAELKEVRKIDCDKADKEARKISFAK